MLGCVNWVSLIKLTISFAENIYLLEFNNTSTKKMCSKLTRKTLKSRHVSFYNLCSDVFREYRKRHNVVLVSFLLTLNIFHPFLFYCWHISHYFPVFLLLIWACICSLGISFLVNSTIKMHSFLESSHVIMYLPLLCTKCFFLLVTIAGTK